MGCPYIRNETAQVMTPEGPRTITVSSATHCPECDSTNIRMTDAECKCMNCGHVLCGAIPQC